MEANSSSIQKDVHYSVFYTNEWSPVVEQQFINGLLREYNDGNYRNGSTNNGAAIRRIMAEVNNCFGKNFDLKFYYDRVRRLQKRYEVFKKIMSMSGVVYNNELNRIECSQAMWDDICKTERLGLVYREIGEPFFPLLRIIFKEEDDSTGYNALTPILQISTELHALSVEEINNQSQTQVLRDHDYWDEIVGQIQDVEEELLNNNSP